MGQLQITNLVVLDNHDYCMSIEFYTFNYQFIPILSTKFYHFAYSPFRLHPFRLLPILPVTHFAYYPFCLLTISPIHHFTYSLILCHHLTFLGNCKFFQDFQSAFKGIVQIANLCTYFSVTKYPVLQSMYTQIIHSKFLQIENLPKT
jgi:hypothetical protein